MAYPDVLGGTGEHYTRRRRAAAISYRPFFHQRKAQSRLACIRRQCDVAVAAPSFSRLPPPPSRRPPVHIFSGPPNQPPTPRLPNTDGTMSQASRPASNAASAARDITVANLLGVPCRN
ncbi:hypothetical protein ACJQWK_04273 [Exserohilum turcicum]